MAYDFKRRNDYAQLLSFFQISETPNRYIIFHIGGMIMPQYVKFEMPQETTKKLVDFLGKVAKTGKVRAGVNEVTKMVERGQAKLVVMAEDVSPEELLYHMPVLCTEKKVPFAYMPQKAELGKVVGLNVNTSCIAVINEGTAKKELEDLVKTLGELMK